MPTLFKIASIFWKQEEKHVKDAYKQLAKKAQDLFAKQIDSLQAINAGKGLGFPQSQLQPQTAAVHPIRLPSIPHDQYKRTPIDTSP
ncbi:11336_t:CDS:1, partial [Ambispora leptoticha]